MKIQKYIQFIKECRERGFGDDIIRNTLISKGWPINDINIAFNQANAIKGLNQKDEYKRETGKYNPKNQITIFLEDDLLKLLDKRAKKCMFTIPELVEDILRRSTINQKSKKSPYDAKLDDKLVGLFSRKRTGPKKK